LHGWPWTFWDFAKTLDRLADPASVGGNAADAFDLIVPSLPGFVFSGPLTTKVDVPKAAQLFSTLMSAVLGYDRYAVAGGDWGSVITAYLSHAYPEQLIGAHMTYASLLSPDSDAFLPEKYSAEEADWPARNLEKAGLIASHIVVHVSDPSSLAFGLNDSPAGLAAWLVERRYRLADNGGDIENVYTMDELCTMLSLYWYTESIASSLRFYTETLRNSDDQYRLPLVNEDRPILKAPSAYAVFPHEVFRAPRASVAEYVNLQRWTVMPRGGHYAPFEEPKLWADDVNEFFHGTL
jgi:pimeloyl-ACP methyl ester carboxylesterase